MYVRLPPPSCIPPPVTSHARFRYPSHSPLAGRPPPTHTHTTHPALPCSFVRISGKMVEKMGANLGYMAATTRRSWQQIMRELGGGGGGGDKAR